MNLAAASTANAIRARLIDVLADVRKQGSKNQKHEGHEAHEEESRNQHQSYNKL
jgi:hypothetical protein